MSTLDFKQEARDQGCLHIGVNPVRERSLPLLKRFLKLLRNMLPVQLAELKGNVLFLRFLDGQTLACWGAGAKKGSMWDQLSVHKAVHGFLGVGQCRSAVDVTNALQCYRDSCRSHQPRLYGSRCILYGPKELELCVAKSSKDGVVLVECSTEDMTDAGPQDLQGNVVERVVEELARSILYNLKARMDSFQRILDEPNRSDTAIKFRAPVEPKDHWDDEVEQRCVEGCREGGEGGLDGRRGVCVQ